MNLTCDENVFKYETAKCSILIISNLEIGFEFNLSVNFGDSEKNLILTYNYSELTISTSFNKSGNYVVKVKLFDYPLFTSSVIRGNNINYKLLV